MFFLYAASVAKIGFSERSVCVFLALLASRGLLFVFCLVFGGFKWSLIGAKWAQCLLLFAAELTYPWVLAAKWSNWGPGGALGLSVLAGFVVVLVFVYAMFDSYI